jgi:ubiquinone/menaquinone biosynthesis C-methylase UbiE
MVVADFGAGSGHYAVASAELVGQSGEVFALDILEDPLSQIATSARLVGIHNISTQVCNLEKIGSCKLPDISCDLVIVSSLLHQVEQKDNVVREAYRVLKTGGKILAVEWTSEAGFGPPVGDRIKKEEVRNLLEKHGFRPVKELPAGSFHYAFLYNK